MSEAQESNVLKIDPLAKEEMRKVFANKANIVNVHEVCAEIRASRSWLEDDSNELVELCARLMITVRMLDTADKLTKSGAAVNVVAQLRLSLQQLDAMKPTEKGKPKPGAEYLTG